MATLDFEYDFDFTLIGIYCHYKDYRLAWRFNNTLNWNLKKSEDHLVRTNSTEQSFPLFCYEVSDHEIFHYLLGNRSENGALIPEKRDVDYFLLVEGLYEDSSKRELLEAVKKTEGVLSALEIDPESLKSRQNLLME